MTDTKNSTSVEHLDTIINGVQEMIDNKIDFNAFILITLGIEYLGNFSDEMDFTAFKQSEIRFKNGLEYFKDIKYRNNKEFLFKELRGPLIHQYRTGDKIRLTSVCNQKAPQIDHFKKDNSDNTILILESFFADFKAAVANFKNRISKDNSLNKNKLDVQYSTITSITSPSTGNDYTTTGSTVDNRYIFNKIVIRDCREKERQEKKKSNNYR